MKKLFTLLILAMVAVGMMNEANATTCAGAASIPGSPTFPYVTTLTCGTTNDITSANSTTCGSASYKGGWEAVYVWTPAGNYIDVSFAYSGVTWTGVFLYQGCPTSGGTCIGNFTSSGSAKTLAYIGTNMTSGTKISLTSGLTYYIVIDTYPTPNSPCPGTLTINGTLNLACSGTPAPGNTVSAANPACSGVDFTLSLQNSTSGSGVTYQWQSSPNGTDSWTNFGASNPTQAASQTADTYYRCQVTCSGNTGTSNPLQVLVSFPISTFPYTEGFEGSWPPGCWNDPVTANYGWNQGPYGTAHSGTKWAYCNLANSALISPAFTLSSDCKLKFWFRAESGSYPQNMDVKIGNTVIYQIISATTTYYQEIILSLASYTGQTINISFVGLTGAGGGAYGICIDDVEIALISKLQGYVYDYYGNPLSGATVEKVGGLSATSGPGGEYLLSPLSSGSQQFKCSKTGYNDVVVTLDIPEGAVLSHDFTLTNPEMAITPGELFEVLQPSETSTVNLYMTNDGNGVLDWQAGVSFDALPLAPRADYCAASASTADEFISRFVLNTIDNSTAGWYSYSDFTGISTSLMIGHTYSIQVNIGPPNYIGDIVGAWIDWDQDADLLDETAIIFTGTPAAQTGTFTVPPDALLGSTRLRVRVVYSTSPFPCGPTNYGETEDYTVNIIDTRWVTLANSNGTLAPFGGNATLPVHFDATKANAGTPGIPGKTYTADIVFNSNPDVGTITVPATLAIADASLKAPIDLAILLIDESKGKFMLKWNYNPIKATSYFIVLRNGQLIATTTNSSYIDKLPGPGNYCYKVARVYSDGAVSVPAGPLCIDYPLVPGVPLSNWALLLGGLLIGVYAFIIIRRRS
jgi:hypothetical protein